MTDAPPRLILHIGARKSGTTFLQAVLRASGDALAAQGASLLHLSRPRQVRAEILPLQHFVATGDDSAARTVFSELGARLRSRPGTTTISTMEDYAELPEQAADLVIGELDGVDVHLVVTCRDWGRTIPSEWQQVVKGRGTVSYPDFLASIRTREGAGARFWMRQDIPGIVRRWGHSLPAERRHVIAVPDRNAAGPDLNELFARVAGLDHTTWATAARPFNISLSYSQAEVLRQVNLALGERLPDVRGDYREGVRRGVTRRGLMRLPRSPIGLPPGDAAWARSEGERQVAELDEIGVRWWGDKDTLVPDPERAIARPYTATTGDLLEAAAGAMAEMAVDRVIDVAEWARVKAERDRLEADLAVATAQIEALTRGRRPWGIGRAARRRGGREDAR